MDSIKVHKNKYSYERVNYINNKTKVEIFCKKCNKYFWQIPNDHLTGHCHYCCNAKKEERLNDYLIEKNIEFERDAVFDECRGKRNKLPFDFYIPKYDLLIEIQGIFHKEQKYKSQDLEERKRLDKIKKEYAEKYHNFLEIQDTQNEIEVFKNYIK